MGASLQNLELETLSDLKDESERTLIGKANRTRVTQLPSDISLRTPAHEHYRYTQALAHTQIHIKHLL